MSDCKDLHKFIMGEFHVDGWKSDWRKAMEADFAARGVSGDSRPVKQARPKAVPVSIVKLPVVKSESQKSRHLLRQRVINRKRRDLMLSKGVCVDCCKVPARTGKTICETCKDERTDRARRRRHRLKVAA